MMPLLLLQNAASFVTMGAAEKETSATKENDMSYDILIRNARTRTHEGLVCIAIQAGKIAAIESEINEEATQVIDAAGRLVTESFVNGHLHLDKVYTLEMAGQTALKEYNAVVWAAR